MGSKLRSNKINGSKNAKVQEKKSNGNNLEKYNKSKLKKNFKKHDQLCLIVTCNIFDNEHLKKVINKIQQMTENTFKEEAVLNLFNLYATDEVIKFSVYNTILILKSIMDSKYELNKLNVTCCLSPNVCIPESFPETWIPAIREALNRRFYVNTETDEVILDLSNFKDDNYLISCGIKLDLNLMPIRYNLCNMLYPVITNLDTLLLNGNKFRDLIGWTEIIIKKKVKTVDISNNSFNSIEHLHIFKNSNVSQLVVGDNPFKNRIKKIKKFIIKKIDNIVILDGEKLKKPLKTKSVCGKDSYLYKFCIKLCNSIEMKNLPILSNLFYEESLMEISSKLSFSYINNGMFSGSESIFNKIMSLPELRFVNDSIGVNINKQDNEIAMDGYLVVSNDQVKHGLSFEIRFTLDTLFVIQNMRLIYKGVSSILVRDFIYDWRSEIEYFQSKPEFTLEQRRSLWSLKKSTNMKLCYLLQLRESCDSDEEALNKFHQMNQSNEIPLYYFI